LHEFTDVNNRVTRSPDSTNTKKRTLETTETTSNENSILDLLTTVDDTAAVPPTKSIRTITKTTSEMKDTLMTLLDEISNRIQPTSVNTVSTPVPTTSTSTTPTSTIVTPTLQQNMQSTTIQHSTVQHSSVPTTTTTTTTTSDKYFETYEAENIKLTNSDNVGDLMIKIEYVLKHLDSLDKVLWNKIRTKSNTVLNAILQFLNKLKFGENALYLLEQQNMVKFNNKPVLFLSTTSDKKVAFYTSQNVIFKYANLPICMDNICVMKNDESSNVLLGFPPVKTCRNSKYIHDTFMHRRVITCDYLSNEISPCVKHIDNIGECDWKYTKPKSIILEYFQTNVLNTTYLAKYICDSKNCYYSKQNPMTKVFDKLFDLQFNKTKFLLMYDTKRYAVQSYFANLFGISTNDAFVLIGLIFVATLPLAFMVTGLMKYLRHRRQVRIHSVRNRAPRRSRRQTRTQASLLASERINQNIAEAIF